MATSNIHQRHGMHKARLSQIVSESSKVFVARETVSELNAQNVQNPGLPVSVKVLTAFFVVLGVLIIGICTWRIVLWKRRKAFAASHRWRVGGYSTDEKVRSIAPPLSHSRNYSQTMFVNLPTTPPHSVRANARAWKPSPFSAADHESIVEVSSAALSPPPTYTANSTPLSTPSSSPRPPPLQLPTVMITHTQGGRPGQIPVDAPVPSPRRFSSFPAEATASPALKAKPTLKAAVPGERLPRHMVVEHTFVPSLADELPIRVGEVLKMLEEYEDEWCLVQRVGERADERGVVPRFCLRERARRGHTRGQSSVDSSARSVRSQ